MKNFFVLIALGAIVLFTTNAQAQKRFMVDGIYGDEPINSETFNNNLFQEILLYKINSHMDSLGLEGYEPESRLIDAARIHAIEMSEIGEAIIEGKGKQKTIRDRLIYSGGSGIGSELVARITIKLSNEYITYENLADQVLSRWSSGKFSKDLLAQKYFFAGVYGQIDESEKKIFVSMYIGNYASFISKDAKAGAKKIHGLKPYDEKICKKVTKKFPVVDMQEGLLINENDEIVFQHNNIKKFRKIIKESKDGLSVDIVQIDDFANCSNMENMINLSNPARGEIIKPTYANYIYQNNTAQGEGKKNRVTKLEVVLGTLPYNANDVELNLVLIKDKYICADIPRSYVDKKIYDFVPQVMLLPDTLEFEVVNKYVPVSTSTELKFRIKFEQGKFDYNQQDMVPVLNALNEPDFIINKIFIEAYSSLEGTLEENQVLQKKRAQNIVKAFEENQNASIVDSIVTSINFKDLKTDVKGTKYEEVSNMSLNDAIKYVNARSREMEPILEKHRYADVTIWVTYDSEGNKEQNYVVDQFNKAVEAKQFDHALAIQKYILKRVVEDLYNENAVSDMRIPQGEHYVGLNMNKLWLTQYVFMDPIDEEYMSKVEELNKLDNSNIYLEYNDILCKIELSTNLDNENEQIKLQNRIDKLYNTSMNVALVDALNIELQYQIMNQYKDSLGYEHPSVVSILSKIKEIIHFDEIKWENSLKLASIFINHNDYFYAVKLLEPWVFEENIPFELLSTYATACTKVEDKIYSKRFYYAMEKIKELDKNYFCSLFTDKKLSYQTFVNTELKGLYCKTCK